MRNDDKIEEVGGLPVRAEHFGFDASDLIVCIPCSRPNPPNRLVCLYCGAQLELPAEVAAGLRFRPGEIEDWEPGVNIVVVGGTIDSDTVNGILSIESHLLEDVKESEPPFPLFRVRSGEANDVVERLRASGISTKKVADEMLDHRRPPARLRGINFHVGSADVDFFNSNRETSIDATAVKLIVVGTIFKSSNEATVRRRRKETQSIDERFFASDHKVIDIYIKNDRGGFRILPHGFDFSCLGREKSLLSVDNMKSLQRRLIDFFPNAILDETYTKKLAALDSVWPRTVTNTSKGVQRVGMKVERSIGESVSNEEQFTRYSRMRRELI